MEKLIFVSSFLTAIMFFSKKHNLTKYYFVKCLPCMAFHVSVVVTFIYWFLFGFDLYINPFTVWVIGWIGYKFFE